MSALHLRENGVHRDLVWGFNSDYLMFFGTAAYTFEGIALVLPIENEMREKEKITCVTLSCMAVIVCLIVTTGSLG